MSDEIERKFLIADPEVLEGLEGQRLRQGYLPTTTGVSVRVRVAGDAAWLTIKGPTRGIQRSEFEYSIPLDDARQLLDTLCRPEQIDKTRYRLAAGAGLVWELDQFHGLNDGLLVAEIELPSVDHPVPSPAWLGREVSNEARFFNSALTRYPYRDWSDEERT